jgi:SSS family solute:Na+ symporter
MAAIRIGCSAGHYRRRGIFLYTSYSGTDQSQVQRELSAPTTADTKKSLVFNGIARFPLTALYILLGVAIFAVYTKNPELGQQVPYSKPDYLVPQFVLLYLPPGLRGLLFAALLAAAMSSLDSALNSLSAATMHDFIAPSLKDHTRLLLFSKLTTVGWGIMITGFAFFVGNISDTVIESINKIGSAFSGPILAAFLVGVVFRTVTARGIIAGILSGVAFNLYLWLGQPKIHWMWWNMFGFLVATAIALLTSRMSKTTIIKNVEEYVLDGHRFKKEERAWLPIYLALSTYFFLMVLLLIML